MEIDGHTYMLGVARIEIEKVTGDYSQFVRIRIRGSTDATDQTLAFSCWRSTTDITSPAPEVTIIDKDERDNANALDAHSEESDR